MPGADWLPPEAIADVKLKHGQSVWFSAVSTLVDANPITAKAQLKTGKYDDKLAPQQLAALNNEADRQIDAMARRQEAERKAAEVQIGKQVSDFKSAVMSGSRWAGNVARLGAAVRGTEHEADFLPVQRNAGELLLFNQMSPLQQEQYIRAKAQAPKTGDDAKFFGDMKLAHEATKAQLNTDPMTLAVMRRVIPPLAPLDLKNPASMQALDTAAGIVEQRYQLGTISPLSDQQADASKTQIDVAPADAKVNIFKPTKRFQR